MKRISIMGILLLLSMLLFSNLYAIVTAQGYVKDSSTNNPLSEASLGFSNASANYYQCQTDVNGYFSVELEAGIYDLCISKSGYITYYSENPIDMSTDLMTYSDYEFLMTLRPPLPSPPYNLLPTGGAINVSTTTNLSWSYNSARTVSMKVNFSTSRTFSTPYYEGVPISSIDISGMLLGKIYYWEVIAISSTGEEWSSGVQSFYTEGAGQIPSVNRWFVDSEFTEYNQGSEFLGNRYLFSGNFRNMTSGLNIGLVCRNKDNLGARWTYNYGSTRDDMTGGFISKSDGTIFLAGNYDKLPLYNDKPLSLIKLKYNDYLDVLTECTDIGQYYVQGSWINISCGVVSGDAGSQILAAWDGDNISLIRVNHLNVLTHQAKILKSGSEEPYPKKIIEQGETAFVVGQFGMYPYIAKVYSSNLVNFSSKKFTEAPFNNGGTFNNLVSDGTYLYVVGSFFNETSMDIVVSKISYDLNTVYWSRSFDGGGIEDGKALCIVDDKLFIVGKSQSQLGNYGVLAISLDFDGNLLWQQYYGNEKDQDPKGCFVNSEGNLVIYGSETDLSTYIKTAFYKELSNVETPAPSTPILVGPIDAVDDISVFVNLKWAYNGNEPISGYRLYLGTDNPPTNSINGLILSPGATSFKTSVLTPNTRYYWRVVPFNASGKTAISKPVWTFMSEQIVSGSGSVNPGAILTINPVSIGAITPSINLEPANLEQAADIVINLGDNVPENIPNPENALAVWMQLISSFDVFPITIEIIFDGVQFNGSIPEIIVNNGAIWTSLGISDIQLLGIDPYHIRFTYNPSSKSTNAYFAFSSNDSSTLPVTLSSFTASSIENNTVKINWTTESESNIAGYHIYRAESENQSEALRVTSHIINANNTCTQCNYSYKDEETSINSTYYYWLNSYDLDGSIHSYGPVSVRINDNTETPIVFNENILHQNYPNPFNSNEATNIKYSLSGLNSERVITNISIFNIKGQKVMTLFEGAHNSGKDFNIQWNGTDNKGKKVPSGIYFYKISTPQFSDIKKLIIMK